MQGKGKAMSTIEQRDGYTVTTRRGEDVLPWLQPEGTLTLTPGARLYTYSDYHGAPEGTVIRLGRKGGAGELLRKRGSTWWSVEGSSAPGLTAYGLENRVSYVEHMHTGFEVGAL